MSEITRISISMEEELVEQFDAYTQEQGFPTRSEAIKNLIRDKLIQSQWEQDAHISGAVMVVYDHHKSGVVQKILTVQHDWDSLIHCSQHVHLDHKHCLEVIIVRGAGREIKEFLYQFRQIKGLKQSVFTESLAHQNGVVSEA